MLYRYICEELVSKGHEDMNLSMSTFGLLSLSSESVTSAGSDQIIEQYWWGHNCGKRIKIETKTKALKSTWKTDRLPWCQIMGGFQIKDILTLIFVISH